MVCKTLFAPNSPIFWKDCGEEEEVEQEVGDNLGVYILNLQIVYVESKSLDHIIKGLCDFIPEVFSLFVTTLLGFVTIGIVVVEIKCF